MTNAAKLMRDWYGYDKKVFQKDYEVDEITGLPDANTPRLVEKTGISMEVARKLQDEFSSAQLETIEEYYFPPSDGFTDEDFLEWVRNNKIDPNLKYARFNWRVLKLIQDNNYSSHDYILTQILNEFFFHYNARNEQLFRVIEINEFLHRGNPGQTFEEFLLTDTEYFDKCRSLNIVKYSKITETLYDYRVVPFLKFGNKVNTKTRKLLLNLTLEEFTKVADYKNNAYYDASRSDAYSFVYVDIFIKSALGEEKPVEITELDSGEVRNQILMRLMSSSIEYWANASNRAELSNILSEIQTELGKCAFYNNNFKRNFAYLIETKALDSINPTELISVVIGYDKSHRWAESSKSKTTLEIVTELIHTKKLDPKMLVRLITHIVSNDLNPVVIELEFDWNSIKDMPIEWAYETLPASSKKNTLIHPAIFRSLT